MREHGTRTDRGALVLQRESPVRMLEVLLVRCSDFAGDAFGRKWWKPFDWTVFIHVFCKCVCVLREEIDLDKSNPKLSRERERQSRRPKDFDMFLVWID